MKKIILGVVLSICSLQAQAQTKTVVLVNDVPITEAKLVQAMKPYEAEIAGSQTVYLKIREKVLDALIEEELVIQEAEVRKIEIPREEIEQIINVIKGRFESEEKFKLAVETAGMSMEEFNEKVKRDLLFQRIKDIELKKRLTVTQEEVDNFCKDYGKKVHAQHILVNTEKEALDILQKAQSGADFSQLAATYSLCPSRQMGGDLGFFGKGQMVPEFEQAAFSMNKEGQLSGVVKTQFGCHIIRFIAKKDPSPEEITSIKTALMNELFGRTYFITGNGLDFEIKRNLEERFIGQKLGVEYIIWLFELKNKAKIVKM
ncbi:MAG: peptidylprolyl isomerase [bacterium]